MGKAKRKIHYTRLFDLICNILLFFIIIYTLYQTFQLDMIPGNWLFLITVALIIVFLIFFMLMFFKMPKWGIFIKRIILFSIAGICLFAGNSMHHVTSAVNKVSISQQKSTVQMHVISLKDSESKQIHDLENKTIGVQIGTDYKNSEYAKIQLEAQLSQPIYDEQLDYTTLTKLFLNNMIDAMIISDDYLHMMEANIEEFENSFQIISTYEKERPINESDNKDITKESFTLLISGVDEMGAADQSSLSDVNILLFINPIANQITMISLPRDSYIPHVALNNANDKLTHTGSYGVDDTVETVENFFNIDIDYYAKVSFSSLIEIVDAIDGIDVDVEITFTEQDENRSFAQEDLIHLEKGMQHLNGKEALAYSRHRKTENYDVAGRERAQEKIIKAIVDKLLTTQGITLYVNRLMEIVPNYVVTNMPGKQITSFIKGELSDLKPWDIQSLSVENGQYDRRIVPNLDGVKSVYLWNPYDYRKLLDAYEESKKNMNFDDFGFDFGNDHTNFLPAASDNPNIIWDYQAIDPY